jgi:hypothetical protein
VNSEERRRRLAERARQAGLGVAAGRERRAAEAERPLAPGDLFVDRRTAGLAVEWAVIDEEEAGSGAGAPAAGGDYGDRRGATATGRGTAAEEPGVAGSGRATRRVLVVPADSMPLRGPADVAVTPAPPLGPLTLRCAHGVWIELERLEPGPRGGLLPDVAVHEARERRRAAAEAAGGPFGTPLEREAEIDPEYRHWVESVLIPAREAMVAAAAGADAPVEPPEPIAARPPVSLADRRRRRGRLPGPWALAASVLLLLAAGLLAGLLRQSHEVDELRASERRLARDLDGLRNERGDLELRLAAEAEAHRRELAERESAAQAVERGLHEQLADLDQRLREALSPQSWVNLPFELLLPWEAVRGEREVVELPAGAQIVGLLLQYHELEDHAAYRLELLRGLEARPIWTAEGVKRYEDLSGFAVFLPGELLAPGEYRWKLYGVSEGGGVKELAEYEMAVVGEGG